MNIGRHKISTTSLGPAKRSIELAVNFANERKQFGLSISSFNLIKNKLGGMVSWLGLWEGKEYQTPYHPSLRHIAFQVSYEDLKESLKWLESIQIEVVPCRRKSIEPFIRPHQGNASVYFNDPDGNSLELMCYVEVPNNLKHITDKLSFEDWEELLKVK